MLVFTPAPPFSPLPTADAPPPPPAPQRPALLPQGLVDAEMLPPAFPFPLAPPVNELYKGAFPPFTCTKPKLDAPPSWPEVLSQLPVAAAPPKPTITVTEAPGVNERVSKETPPPPAPAP